jgi:YfiH family protein
MVRLGLPAEALATLHQVHGREVITLDRPPAQPRPRADALVTRQPSLALGVLAADCVPVLLADPEARVIGACHAGWKGALAGIAQATVAAMSDLGARPERIRAAIGPAIRQVSYEVGPEFPDPFLTAAPGNARWFIPSDTPGRHLFDLPGYVADRLQAAGVGRIDDLGLDTRSDPDRFFSFRRGTLAGEADYGRQLSAIALEPER